MILKIDDITTDQFYELVTWLASNKNRVTLDEVRKMEDHDAKTVNEITRNHYRRSSDMEKYLSNVIRVVSVKSKLTPGNSKNENDSYDIVLEIPQAMFLWQPYSRSGPHIAPRIVSIPARIMGETLGILADNPNLSPQ